MDRYEIVVIHPDGSRIPLYEVEHGTNNFTSREEALDVIEELREAHDRGHGPFQYEDFPELGIDLRPVYTTNRR